MFNLTDQIEDTIKDEVLLLLNSLNSRNTWNTQAKNHHAELINLLERKRYQYFAGHPSRYHLTRIGQSCLYDIPLNRRGFLAIFRGKRIRLVCMSSGRYERWLMAGVMGDAPAEKLQPQKKTPPVFPLIGDHEIAYLGRRYMLIKTDGKFIMPLYEGADSFIDPDSCDFILLDGMACCPIATLQIDAKGILTGKLTESMWNERYGSIPEAIRGLAKKNARYARAVLR
jgi:hypothetical protein